jgi:hypothetical protein
MVVPVRQQIVLEDTALSGEDLDASLVAGDPSFGN